MKMKIPHRKVWGIGLLLAGAVGLMAMWPSPEIDYNTQVKPILNKHCISCHGGVTAKGGFSLLFREEALAPTQSGKPAIVPGHPGQSDMIRRLTLTDPEERMPYKHAPLSDEDIKILTQWVKQGAKWGVHWAYKPVEKYKVPAEAIAPYGNDIDAYIAAQLADKDLQPAPMADRPTLLRRVSLDLIGTYPDAAWANRFLTAQDSLAAYETLVDSLLASPRFGEKWATMWLDIARYADTKGYESDGGRNIWRYRDWVIDALNRDIPYDQFITEQLAGDLLPRPTDAQYLATAFHRNAMSNDEGGTQNEEFRVSAVMDRVNTTWEGIMGTTFACVQCHSHPYDPFKHEEYYKFYAYFNNSRDEDVPPEYPLLRHYSPSQADSVRQLVAWVAAQGTAADAARIEKLVRTGQPAYHSAYANALENSAIGNNNWALFLRNHGLAQMPDFPFGGADRMAFRYNATQAGGKLELRIDSASGPLLAAIALPKTQGYTNYWVDIPATTGKRHLYIRYHNAALPKNTDFVVFFDWIHAGRHLPGRGKPAHAAYDAMLRHLLEVQPPGTPIMVENEPGLGRSTHVFDRGAWTAPGQAVTPGVPTSLAFAMPANAPPNRLGLSQWLTDKRHPLVSRTLANRLWEQLFGTGLAETLEDMGTQGIAPTHPALLDYLAYRLMYDWQWSLKQTLKYLVMSGTYRQSSKQQARDAGKDPMNRYYARGPRTRLTAEQVRDQHLAISGLLSTRMYGPGVMPWQPEGIWLSPYNGATWQNSSGEDQYRRAIYTYWKRTAPYPSMMTFDGAQRVVCNARRIPTNTPLQALVTLNDPAYLDMARHFAYRMLQAAPTGAEAQIAAGYRMMLYKPIAPGTLAALMRLYHTALAQYEQDSDAACQILGEVNRHSAPATSALVVVANALLNLDEVIMKN